MKSIPTPAENTSPIPPENKIVLYARAAANLYGIISFDEFFKILEVYYGEGSLSKEKVFFFFWTAPPDPVFYVQDEWIVHSSVPPDQALHVYEEIHYGDARTHGQRRILPEKDFLQYANPAFYEETPGTKEMSAFLEKELGLSPEDVRDIVTEMDFLCRSGADPTYLMDALNRREIPCNRDCELNIVTHGCVLEGEARLWESLGFTGRELQAWIA